MIIYPVDMIPEAVAYCMRESPEYNTADEVVNGLKAGDPMLNSRLRQSIAKNAVVYLSAEFGSRIKAARLYGSTAEYNAGVFSDIDIVFLVTELPENFRQVISGMDKILSESYFRLIGKDQNEWSYLLDIHVINEDPYEQRHPSRAYLENIFINGSVAV